MTALNDWGWSEAQDRLKARTRLRNVLAGRIIAEHAGLFRVVVEGGDVVLARPTGKLRSVSDKDSSQRPVVGDFVLLGGAAGRGENSLSEVLERKSLIARRDLETQMVQPIAANVDSVFISTAISGDVNLRRIERYLAMVHEGGATPVLVLTKADLVTQEEQEALLAGVRTVASNVEVLLVSAKTGQGLAELDARVKPGETHALIGSSGVGKSTLINRWLGDERLATRAVDDAGKGRHTTTHRQLLRVPSGALIIDTPGMRELALLDANEGLLSAFPDIEALAASCRFRDCAHEAEPGCAVRLAVESGELDEERFESFRKLRAEVQGQGGFGRAARHDSYNRKKR